MLRMSDLPKWLNLLLRLAPLQQPYAQHVLPCCYSTRDLLVGKHCILNASPQAICPNELGVTVKRVLPCHAALPGMLCDAHTLI